MDMSHMSKAYKGDCSCTVSTQVYYAHQYIATQKEAIIDGRTREINKIKAITVTFLLHNPPRDFI